MTSEGDTTQLLSREENTPEECQSDSKRKYRRISLTKRNLLLEKIFFENKKIKNAARELGINYSSAKTILHLYRKKAKKQNQHGQNEEKRCGYVVLRDTLAASTQPGATKTALNKIDIVVSQGGRNMCSISLSSAIPQQQQPTSSGALPAQPLFGELAAKLDDRARMNALHAPQMPLHTSSFTAFPLAQQQQQQQQQQSAVNLNDSNTSLTSTTQQQQQQASALPQFPAIMPPAFGACTSNPLFLQQMLQFQQSLIQAYSAANANPLYQQQQMTQAQQPYVQKC